MSNKINVFKEFNVKLNVLIKLSDDFAVLWENYKLILSRCPMEYIDHYCKHLMAGKDFILYEVMSMLKDNIFSSTTSSVETIQLADIKIHLNKISALMNEKIGKLGNVFYARAKPPPNGMGDIRYNNCVFDLSFGQVTITSNKNKVLFNYSSDESVWSFKPPRNMTDSINSLVIPNPPDAPSSYNHAEFNVIVNQPTSGHNIIEDVTGTVEAFNRRNGLGSRQTPLVKGSASKRIRSNTSALIPTGGFSPNNTSSTFTADTFSPLNTSGNSDTTMESLSCSSAKSLALLSDTPSASTDTHSASTAGGNCDDNSDSVSPTNSRNNEYDSITQLVNDTCDTPERVVLVLSNDASVAVGGIAGETHVVAAYNFDDESKNVQPKFNSTFLNNFDDASSDSDNYLSGSREKANKMKAYAKNRAEVRKRSGVQQDLSSSEESVIDENASDSEFFVQDGTYEGIHPESAFRARVDKGMSRSKPTLKKGGLVDEEYNTSSDEDVKRYKVQKSAQSKLLHDSQPKKKDHRKSVKTSSTPEHRSASAVVAGNHQRVASKKQSHQTPVVASVNNTLSDHDSLNFSKVLRSVVLKKRTRDDYKANPLEDLSMHVTNVIRTSDVTLPPQDCKDLAVSDSPEFTASIKSQNKTLDRNMVLFLVKDATTRIGADIALECCIMDYLCKKQTINRVSKLEQQRIENLEELFLNIERLISYEIRLEHEKNHNVLERAHQRTKKSIVNKCLIKQSLIQQSDTSDTMKLDAEETLKKKEKELVAKLARIATEAKSFNQQACRFSLRKVNSTLHYVCGKFCAVWLEANNCISDISPELLRHYHSRAERDAASIKQLISATKNGVFLLDCDLELAEGVETRGSPEEQQAEEIELRRILDSDHVESVQQTIRSIADDSERIKKLIKIVWTKETRVKLSHTIAKAKKEETDAAVIAKTDASGSSVQILTPVAVSIPNGIPIANSVRFEQPPMVQSLESAAVGSKKITSFYGANSSETESKSPIRALDAESLAIGTSGIIPSNQAMALTRRPEQRNHADKFVGDPQSSLTKIAQTFDKAFLLISGRVQTVSATQCLEITVKSRSISVMLLRLRLLQFLLANKSKDPSTVVSLLQRTDMYDLFDCYFLMRGSNLSASNTGSDGYCMTRCQRQLYIRVENDFKTTVAEMRELDKTCNSSRAENTNASFISFINDLPSLMKTNSKENQTLIDVMSELAYFKRMKQLEIMPALLSVRPPGTALGASFWGDLQTVTMLGFNATAFSLLVENEFMQMIPKLRCNWIKYEASSVPKPRSAASLRISKRPLSEIDQVLSEDLNIMVYGSSHYFVCDNPGPIQTVMETFEQLKASAIEELLKRVSLIETMTPDVLVQLTNVINNSENKSQSVDFDYFDFATFEKTFTKKFPQGVVDGTLVDLTDEPEDGETNTEIYKLKRALDLSNAKLKIAEEYGLALRESCCALSVPCSSPQSSSSISSPLPSTGMLK